MDKKTQEDQLNQMKNLLTVMAQALVDEPDKVIVKEIKGGQTIVFELYVAEGEVGKLIGKQGVTARALRQILNSVATKLGKRAVLEIIE